MSTDLILPHQMDKSGLVHMVDNNLLEGRGASVCVLVCACDVSSTSDLGRMYKLYSRVDGGLLCLMKCMSAHLRETGEEEQQSRA